MKFSSKINFVFFQRLIQPRLFLMFGRNLKKRIETRCLVDAFGGHCIWFGWLGKKIGSDEIWQNFMKIEILSTSYLLSSQPNHIQWPPNTPTKHLITSHLFRFLPNIIGSRVWIKTLQKTTKFLQFFATHPFPILMFPQKLIYAHALSIRRSF
jgi:hypothetical protein